MQRRIVITGMGVISPLGDTPESLYRSQIEAKSAAAPITHFDASTFPTTFAAEVPDFDLARYVKGCERWQDAGLNSQFAAAAAQLALQHAGLLDDRRVDRTRFGVYLGTGEGIQDFEHLIWMIGESALADAPTLDYGQFCRLGMQWYQPGWELEQELHRPSGHIGCHFNLRGPNFSCLTACAAGSQAIGEAAEIIRDGAADLMLAGGTHSMIHPFGVMGFNLLTALSTRNGAPKKASRPFDQRRDGFVIGEGAGLVVLEELEHARRRGATIHAELTGYGASADAYRVTDCHPDGRGAIACMEAALADAGLSARDIGYINAHGTSTQVNDRVETVAIKQVFGERAYQIPISSSKSMLGHLIGAAGAVELIICVLALQQSVLPPTINYEYPDPDCDLDYIPNVAREKRVQHILSNSFGFGGQNVSVIVSSYR
jgi:3-oxoacyl-[acyl-carrier-protein] synthase II